MKNKRENININIIKFEKKIIEIIKTSLKVTSISKKTLQI